MKIKTAGYFGLLTTIYTSMPPHIPEDHISNIFVTVGKSSLIFLSRFPVEVIE
jgi:hypothetical protein